MMLPTAPPGPGVPQSASPARWGIGWALAGAVSLLMLAPALRPGFVLRYDMVFVPDPAINARSLGLDGSVPRAVPMDFLVALVSTGVPAEVVQKVLLLAAPLVAVTGMWGLLRSAGTVGQVAGSLAFAWNAFVYERLFLGHWSLLLGVAVLPWVVAAALDQRAGAPRALRRLILLLGVATVATPTTGVLAVVVAVGVLVAPSGGEPLRERLRPTGLVVAGGIVLSAPWWVPGLLAVTRGAADPTGVGAFAPRSDTPLGVLGSLLTSGGVWDSAAVPAGRDNVLVTLALVLVLVVAALGLPGAARCWGRPPLVGLAVVALAGLALAVLGTVPGGSSLLQRLVSDVPAAGLLRDGQKLAAPWLLLASIGFGFGVARVRDAPRLGSAARPVGVMLAILPVAVLPGLGWGASGLLTPVAYPSDYASVREALAHSSAAGDALVLPWHLYRSWSWNSRTVSLDPFQRMLERRVVVRDDLELADRVVAGEDPRVPPIGAALSSGEPLARILPGLGVGFVVVDRDTAGGPVPDAALAGLQLVMHGRDLDLYTAPGALDSGPRRGVPIILTADVVAALLWLGLAASFALPKVRPLLES